MNEDNNINCKKERQMDVMLELYRQAMEDIRDRRKIEWQTFIVANAVYLGLLKVLHDYKGTISTPYAIVGLLVITLFTYIWFIRIYGNSRRCDFPTQMRNKIQNHLANDPVICNLMPPHSVYTDGGLKWHKAEWPLWTYRGISAVIWLYWAILVSGVLRKTDGAVFSIGLKIHNILDFSALCSLDKAYQVDTWRFNWITGLVPFALAFLIIFTLEVKLKRRRDIFLFSIPKECDNYSETLNNGRVPDALRREFVKLNITLSKKCEIKPKWPKKRNWFVIDRCNAKLYFVKDRRLIPKRRFVPKKIRERFERSEREIRVHLVKAPEIIKP